MQIASTPRPLMGLAALAIGGAVLAMGLLQGRTDPGLIPEMAGVAYAGMPDGARFYMQVTEVTVADWSRCREAGGCSLKLQPLPGAAPEDYPATGLSAIDAAEYLAWLNQATGESFRLPTEAEWYAAAASVLPELPDPLFSQPELSWAASYPLAPASDRRLRPTGSHSRTAEGIVDLDGNVWEWTRNCHDGSVSGRCTAFVVAGEHRAVISFMVRDPTRGGCAVGPAPAHLGMRVVSERPVPST